jgi:hypothetical protein
VCSPFVVPCLEELEVGGPAVTDDLATCEGMGSVSCESFQGARGGVSRTREAPDWDDHGAGTSCKSGRVFYKERVARG